MSIDKIRKRDGREVNFDLNKIKEAVGKASNSVEYKMGEQELNEITKAIVGRLQDRIKTYKDKKKNRLIDEDISIPDVEFIQDIVEETLINLGKADIAKAYIVYRANRSRIRETKMSLMQDIAEFTFADASDFEKKRENANINGDTTMGTMLRYGSESAKHFNMNYMVSKRFSDAHRDGDIHMHDADFLALTFNCCQIGLEELFKGGFNTGHGFLREPQDIRSYGALACIAIQSNQNDMFGGQAIPAFDHYMAPGVAKTFIKQVADVTLDKYEDDIEDIELKLNEVSAKLKDYLKNNRLIMNETGKKFIKNTLYEVLSLSIKESEKIIKRAYKKTEKCTYQSMEAVIANLNSMHSRAGSQTPFSSLNFGTDTSTEGRMVIKNFLLSAERGLGFGETPIFPISIFKLRKGVSYDKGDPNYDLFKLACRVSAKQMYPNFSNLDVEFNSKYYKEGDYRTEATYMGCVQGDEVITYKIDEDLYVESFSRAYERILRGFGKEQKYGESHYINVENKHITIFDSNAEDFVAVKKFIRNPNRDNWVKITFTGGRSLIATEDHPLPVINKGRITIKDLNIGDKIRATYEQYSETTDDIEPSSAFLLGLITSEKDDELAQEVFKFNTEAKYSFIQGLLEGIGYKTEGIKYYDIIDFECKGMALQVLALIQSVGIRCNYYELDNKSYRIIFEENKELRDNVVLNRVSITKEKVQDLGNKSDIIEVIEIIRNYGIQESSYDVETESDRFDVSGLLSHNCRTHLIANTYDPSNEISPGRGNLTFTTINIVRLAILAGYGNIDKFFELLEEKLQLVLDQLLERFEIICKRHPKNFPFLMGQGVWLGSDKLGPDDDIREILKQGSLGIGFIGLAETLIALTGKHQGESEESQQLGLKIVGYMRDFCDKASETYNMNFGLIGTPAEGLSGRFTELDKKRFGIIRGITDKDFYTNSFHVPVYYKISAFKKIDIEAPYHALTNGGHITYIEIDGDPTKNLKAFEKVVRYMHDKGIGYGAINHPIDRDPVCGYQGIIGDVCPRCGRRDGEPMSLEVWNRLKKIPMSARSSSSLLVNPDEEAMRVSNTLE